MRRFALAENLRGYRFDFIPKKVSLMSSTLKIREALMALALTGCIGAAQAQSSYALTKLSEPFLGKFDAYENAGQIDSQNRVTATGRYVSGFTLYSWGQNPGFTYTNHVSR